MEAKKMCLFLFIWNLICEERKIFYAHKIFLKQTHLPIMSLNLMDADKKELFKRNIALKNLLQRFVLKKNSTFFKLNID